MERGAVGILLLAGFCSLSSSSHPRALHFIPKRADWATARAHCRENHVDLATIDDGSDLAALGGLVDAGDEYVFVGLQRIWAWDRSESADYRERALTYKNFRTGEPNAWNDCGTMTSTGEWSTEKCSTELPFFCHDESAPDRFVEGNGTMSWAHARSYCKRNHTALARIRNLEENQLLLSVYRTGPAWIGLSQTVWTWSDGSHASFIPWTSEAPRMDGDRLCSALHVTAKPPGIVDRDCTDTLPFFCYSRGQKKYSVKVKISVPDGAVDLADAALSDSLLQLIQTKLKDQGVSRDLRLSWSKAPLKITPEPEPEPAERTCPLV